MQDFKELAEETLEKIKGFGIKSKTVISSFNQSCKMLEAFLQKHCLDFTTESAEYLLSGFKSLKSGTQHQRHLYLSHRRA